MRVKPYRLGDGCSIAHGFAFSGMLESNNEELPIVVNIGNFKYSGGFRFESTKIQRCRGEYAERFRLAPGDVLLVMTCQTAGGEILGIPGRIPADGATYLHNQRLGKVNVTRPDELDLGYLYYLFLSPKFNAHLVATATGSKILHTAPGRIENFVWPRPDLDTQRRIAKVLSAYDDLIENNTKRIGVLKEMARSLYREWFENFRVPGHENMKMVNSPRGKIPNGWRAATLGDALTLQRGFDLPERDRRPGSVPIVSSSGMTGLHDQAKVSAPGVVTGRYGTLGEVYLVDEPFWPLNTTLFVKDFKGNSPYWILHQLRALNFGAQNAAGAVPGVNRNALHLLPVVLPTKDVQADFDEIVVPIHQHMRVLSRLVERLETLRDLLLPRLVEGGVPLA